MYCKNHPEKEAVGICVYCGAPFCSDCLVDVNGKKYCKEHNAVRPEVAPRE